MAKITDTKDDFSDFFQLGGPTKSFNVDYSNDPITVEGQIMGRPNQPKAKPKPKPKPISKPKVKPLEKRQPSRKPGLGPIEKVDISTSENVISPDTKAQVAATDKQTAAIQEQTAFSKNSALLTAASQFMFDTLNANNAYSAMEIEGQFQILESKRLANDAIARGRQRALEAQVEGMEAADSAVLALAAQGQDVYGTGVSQVESSFEQVGLINALEEEIAGYREALGYELEQVAINYKLDQAKVERDLSIAGSALNLAANAAFTL